MYVTPCLKGLVKRISLPQTVWNLHCVKKKASVQIADVLESRI